MKILLNVAVLSVASLSLAGCASDVDLSVAVPDPDAVVVAGGPYVIPGATVVVPGGRTVGGGGTTVSHVPASVHPTHAPAPAPARPASAPRPVTSKPLRPY